MSRFAGITNATSGNPLAGQRPKPQNEQIEFVDETEGDGTTVEKPANQQTQQQQMEQFMKMGEQKALARLMTDPDFQKLWSAKQKQQRVRIFADGEGQAEGTVERDPGREQTEEEDVDVNELDNRQLAGHILKSIDKLLTSKLGQVVDPIKQGQEQFKQFAQQQINKDIKRQIDETRNQFSDFDKYIEGMERLSAENPNLGPKQLYLLAKAEKLPLKGDRSTDSERPSATINRPSRVINTEGVQRGAAGFGQLLRAAVNGANFETQFDE
jgi:hypothetical protein